MDMDAEGMCFATHYLRDKIYADKVLAVVREYLANALDEHAKHGVFMPVRVTLPTHNDLNFRVRDFGKGLDDNGVRYFFGRYFKSTKNESREAVGGFGIGSKSGHAYADQFSVVSWHNGLCTSYVCPLEGNGHTAMGKILKIDSVRSSEPDGIEITVPVAPDNVYDFGSRLSGLLKHLPKNHRVLVTHGVNQKEHSFDASTYHQMGVVNTLGQDYKWGLQKETGGNITIVVGFVPYVLSFNDIRRHCGNVKLELLSGLVVWCDPSDVTVALNRESLEFSNQTVSFLTQVLTSVHSNIVGIVAKDIAACATAREAQAKFAKLDYRLQQEKDIRDSWNGVNLARLEVTPQSIVNIASSIVHCGYEPYKVYRTKLYRASGGAIGRDTDLIVLFDDGTRCLGYMDDLVAKHPTIQRFVFVGRKAYNDHICKIQNHDQSAHPDHTLETLQISLKHVPDLYSKFVVNAANYTKTKAVRKTGSHARSDKYIYYSVDVYNGALSRLDAAKTASFLNKGNASNYVIARRITERQIGTGDAAWILNLKYSRGIDLLGGMLRELTEDGKTLIVLNEQAWRDLNGSYTTLSEWKKNFVPKITEDDREIMMLTLAWEYEVRIFIFSAAKHLECLRSLDKALASSVFGEDLAKRIQYMQNAVERKLSGVLLPSKVELLQEETQKAIDQFRIDVQTVRKNNAFLFALLDAGIISKFPKETRDLLKKYAGEQVSD